jgi:serine/threonine protein kinase
MAPLQRTISASGPFSLRARLNVAIGLASGLRFLHGNGVVHGDIRSATLHLEGGTECKLSLVDAYTAFQSWHTTPGLQIAFEESVPWAWRAPELWATASSATPSAKSDIYSVGCVLLELFAGSATAVSLDRVPLADRVPYYGQDIAAAKANLAPPPQIASPMNSTLAALVARCLHHSPDMRPSATLLLAALLACARLYPEFEARDASTHQRYVQETSSVAVAEVALLLTLSPEQTTILTSEDKDAEDCVICLDDPCTHMCLPCRHRCLCAVCSMHNLQACPVCREPIQKVERIQP